MNARHIRAVLGCAAMLVLILDAKTALSGAKEGVELCLWTVIPALFPFFVASNLLSGNLNARFLRPLGKLLRLPQGAEPILLAGFLGGYPVGAKCIADAVSSGSLTREDGRRMLGFCSNAGPAFIFGVVANQLGGWKVAALLWGSHILSALVVGVLLPSSPVTHPVRIAKMQADPLQSSLRAIGSVCGWVVLMRVVIAVGDRWIGWLLPRNWQIALSGLLELTNGCCMLRKIENPSLRMLLCTIFLNFGGLCVLMQTASVADSCGLGYYFPGKVMQTCFGILLITAWQRLPFHPGLILCILIPFGIKFLLEKRRGMVYTGTIKAKKEPAYAVSP